MSLARVLANVVESILIISCSGRARRYLRTRRDPVVVMGLAVVFIGSVVVLHLINKLTRALMK